MAGFGQGRIFASRGGSLGGEGRGSRRSSRDREGSWELVDEEGWLLLSISGGVMYGAMAQSRVLWCRKGRQLYVVTAYFFFPPPCVDFGFPGGCSR